MLTPKELYEKYSNDPCSRNLGSPYSQLGFDDVYNPLGVFFDVGAGTPINWLRIIKFFKHVKYPCFEGAPHIEEILDTGQDKLCLAFRFLQSMDIEAYKERQPNVRAGTSHSVRNTCDLSRACYLIANNLEDHWYARMATEYLEYFAHNSLPDCLMMCGPDLVDPVVAEFYRAPGYKVESDEPYTISGASSYDEDGSILEEAAENDIGMLCFPKSPKGVAGARHTCIPPNAENPQCGSCSECPRNDAGNPTDPDNPCCQSQSSIYYANECCNTSVIITLSNKPGLFDVIDRGTLYAEGVAGAAARTLSVQLKNRSLALTNRIIDFNLWVKSDDGIYDGTFANGRVGERIKQVGLLERACYDGYADFTGQCSAYNLPIMFEDTFLKNRVLELEEFPYLYIYKAKTISLILKATVDAYANTTTDAEWMLKRVKDLLWNGYGVLLLTNVGFPDVRDSTGVSYPDRIFYQTYSIIGYDDTKTLYNECVYVLQCPFGDWNRGGHPEWGELPTGSFLVTESHLRCMVNYFPTHDFSGCGNCGADIVGRCDPYDCRKQQSAFGFLFAISLSEGFPEQELDHTKYYPVESIKDILKEQKLYYRPPS
jgi:hypothetical protein